MMYWSECPITIFPHRSHITRVKQIPKSLLQLPLLHRTLKVTLITTAKTAKRNPKRKPFRITEARIFIAQKSMPPGASSQGSSDRFVPARPATSFGFKVWGLLKGVYKENLMRSPPKGRVFLGG